MFPTDMLVQLQQGYRTCLKEVSANLGAGGGGHGFVLLWFCFALALWCSCCRVHFDTCILKERKIYTSSLGMSHNCNCTKIGFICQKCYVVMQWEDLVAFRPTVTIMKGVICRA